MNNRLVWFMLLNLSRGKYWLHNHFDGGTSLYLDDILFISSLVGALTSEFVFFVSKKSLQILLQ